VTNAKRNAIVLLLTLLGASILLASPSARAADADASVVMKPGQMVTLDAGPTRIVSSFVTTDGQCDLSARISRAFLEGSNEMSSGAVRVQTTLAPGSTSRIDAGAGYLLQFACKTGANVMIATTLGEARDFAGDDEARMLASDAGRHLAMLRATGI
jgi:hypothetical protein